MTTTIAQTIIVTGASSGIGKATCELLLQQGYKVIGIARRETDITHENFQSLCGDLSDLENLPSFLETLVKHNPQIDGLICNAGRGQFGSLEEFSYEQIQKLMDLNFSSHAFVARAIVPLMKRNKSGRIIFIGSESALEGSRMGSIYCASKFALRGFSQALRDECSKSGIQVSIINPGMVKTAFFDDLSFMHGDDPSNHIDSIDVANTIQFILNAPDGTVVDEINLSPLKHVVQSKN